MRSMCDDQAEVEELLRRILAEASAAREDIHVDPGELEIEIEKFLEAADGDNSGEVDWLEFKRAVIRRSRLAPQRFLSSVQIHDPVHGTS